jgi:hypothetical protein
MARPFIGCKVELGVARTPRSGGGHGHGSTCLAGVADGPCGPGGWAGMDWVGPSGSAQVEKDRFYFFRNYFPVKNKFRKNPENVYRNEKYPENSKNSKKILEDKLRHEQSK